MHSGDEGDIVSFRLMILLSFRAHFIAPLLLASFRANIRL
jgi:hypothetical protein